MIQTDIPYKKELSIREINTLIDKAIQIETMLNEQFYELIEQCLIPPTKLARAIGTGYRHYRYRVTEKAFSKEEMKTLTNYITTYHENMNKHLINMA